MRKDVILGMSIGGIVLAILVVYLTAGPSGKVKSAIQLDTGNGTTDVQGSGPGDADATPAADHSNDIGNAAATRLASRSGNDVTGGVDAAPGRNPTDGARAAAATVGAGDSSQVDKGWRDRLYGATPLIGGGETPGGSGSTSSPEGGTQNTQLAMSTTVRPAPGEISTGSLRRSVAASVTPTPATRPTQALTAHQHRVQQGESFSSIAAAAYGSANFYPHILRANPGLDPRKLRPGVVINMPNVADVKPAAKPATEPPVMALMAQAGPGREGTPASGRESTPGTPTPNVTPAVTPAAADGSRQSRVQSGDNLHRIAIKAYGKISMVGAIYEANKQAIGPDMAKLKLGTVLKLPAATAAEGPR